MNAARSRLPAIAPLILLSLSYAPGALAGLVSYANDQSAWLGAIGGASAISVSEDFNSFTSDVLIEGSSLDLGPLTISASSSGVTLFNRIDAPPHSSGQANQNGSASYYGLNNVNFTFATALAAVGFDYLDQGSPEQAYNLTVNLLGGGSQVFNLGVPGTAEFRGFVATEGDLISSIAWAQGPSTSTFSVDNILMAESLLVSELPVPPALALIGLGVAGLFGLRRRPLRAGD